MDAKWLLGKKFENALIVVADNSEDRLVHLKKIGLNPRLLPSNFKADMLYGLCLTPFTLAKTSAEAKACDVAAQLKNQQENYDMVLGFHTVQVIDNKVIPKPSNRIEALAVLKQLNNRWHSVITGVTCLHSSQKYQTFSVETQVKYGDIPEEMLVEYVETDEWLNQNSAYGKASAFIESNNGCFFNMLGVPIFDVVKTIRSLMLDADMKSLTVAQSPMDHMFTTPKMPLCEKTVVGSDTQATTDPYAFDDFWDQLSEPVTGPQSIKRRFYKSDNIFINRRIRYNTPLPPQHQTFLELCPSATVDASTTISYVDSQETRVEESQDAYSPTFIRGKPGLYD